MPCRARRVISVSLAGKFELLCLSLLTLRKTIAKRINPFLSNVSTWLDFRQLSALVRAVRVNGVPVRQIKRNLLFLTEEN